MVQLSHPYMTTGKTFVGKVMSLIIQTFVAKVMSLLSTHCLGGFNNQLTSNFTETRQVSYKALLYSVVLIVNIMYT